MMADLMPKKNYDLTEITRLLLEMRENCVPKAGNAYEDPNRAEKYDALNAAIDLINNPSMLAQWISVKDRLPGKKGEYIVNCQHRYHDGFVRNYVTVIYFRGKTQWATGNESISHWMSLPEPPKEES